VPGSATPPTAGDELVDPSETELAPRFLQTPRAAGVAGILFALMFGVIVVLFRSVLPLDPRSAGNWLTNAGDRRDLDLALALIPFCGIFFLWFLGAVRAHIGDAEDKFFATIVLGSGLLFIAMLFVFGARFGALVSLAGLYHGEPPLALWRLGREISFNIAMVYAMRVGAVLMFSSSVIAYRLRIHVRPVIVVGFAGALVLLFASPTTPWLQLVFPFWVLVVSINILVRRLLSGDRLLSHSSRCSTTRQHSGGREERLAATLSRLFPDVDVGLARRPSGTQPDDILDAYVAAWTARRWLDGTHLRLGGDLAVRSLSR